MNEPGTKMNQSYQTAAQQTAQETPHTEEMSEGAPPAPQLRGLERLIRLLRPPVLSDTFSGESSTETTSDKARLLYNIILLGIGLNLMGLLAAWILLRTNGQIGNGAGPATLVILGGALAAQVICYGILHRGRVRAAAGLYTFGLYILLSWAAAYTGGIINPIYGGLVLVVLLAVVLAGTGWGLGVALLSILSGLLLWRMEALGQLPEAVFVPMPVTHWIVPSAIFLAALLLVRAVQRGQQRLLGAAQTAQHNALAEIRQLEASQLALENDRAQRSLELEASLRNWQLAIEIGSTIFAIADARQWVQLVLERVQEHFNLYFAGIFLVPIANETGQEDQGSQNIGFSSAGFGADQDEWAELYAGTGEAGEALVKRSYRIRVGTGMVGWSISNRRARLAAQTEADAVRLATPELPETRSEAAIPLRIHQRAIGALSVQSKELAAFTVSDLDILQVIADIIAGALYSAGATHSAAQGSFQEIQAEAASADSSRYEMSSAPSPEAPPLSSLRSYRYERHGSTGKTSLPSVMPAEMQDQIQQIVEDGHSATDEKGKTLFVPVKVRHEVIAVLTFHKDANHDGARWTDEETSLLESIAEQLGAAIDSARLYEDTQRLARREQIAAEATAHIRQTLDIETVLRAAAQEIHNITHAAQVVISLTQQELSEAPDSPQPIAPLDSSRGLSSSGSPHKDIP